MRATKVSDKDVSSCFSFLNDLVRRKKRSMGSCCQTSVINNSTETLGLVPASFRYIAVIGSGIYGIGKGSRQFGLDHTLHLGNLVPLLSDISSDAQVSNILCGYDYTVYIINNDTYSNCNINNNESKHENINISDNIYVAGIIKDKDDYGLYQIKHFVENNIIIKQVCVNVMSSCIFFITNSNQVYGCGKNDFGNLGIGDTKDTSLLSPVVIEYFSHLQTKIIDIQSNGYYSLALTSATLNNPKYIEILVNCWTNSATNNIDIPKDLIHIIGKYCNIGNQVHSSNKYPMTTSEEVHDRMIPKWRKQDFFDGKNIVSLTIGHTCTFLLEASGKIWSVWTDEQKYPTVVEYFVENDIKIVDIKCGGRHILAIDSNYNVYSWGYNDLGQCGHDRGINASSSVSTPKLIVDLAKYKIVKIDCGKNHSYCCSQDGNHWMFGNNMHNECVVDAINTQTSGNQASVKNQYPWILSPYCIDDKSRIQCISLGNDCTIMILDL